jgi:hypothetical protein
MRLLIFFTKENLTIGVNIPAIAEPLAEAFDPLIPKLRSPVFIIRTQREIAHQLEKELHQGNRALNTAPDQCNQEILEPPRDFLTKVFDIFVLGQVSKWVKHKMLSTYSDTRDKYRRIGLNFQASKNAIDIFRELACIVCLEHFHNRWYIAADVDLILILEF